MTQYLPPNLLALFNARDPVTYLPPVDQLSWEKKTDGYTGVASLMHRFENPVDTPPPVKLETREERLERKRKEKAEQVQYKLEQEIAMWDPLTSESATSDPYKTLFIARINYDTSESKLRREFELYGPIKKISLVHAKNSGKPRGYAFIEYEHERDMHSGYKHADGKKMDNRRVLVDVERARTVKGWLPRRLGGGLGGTRRGGSDVNIKHSGREDDRKRIDETRGSRERETRDVGKERDIREGGKERDRDRGERDRKRDRERDQRRRRSRSRDKKRRRSRSRNGAEDEERRRHRSKSRERKRRPSRERSRERKHRRDNRDRDRERNRADIDETLNSVKIKQEPDDDYPDFAGTYYNNFPLKDEEKPKNGTKYEDEQDNEIDY